MVDLLRDKGMQRTIAIETVSLVSFTDTAGRLFLPSIADRGIVDRKVSQRLSQLLISHRISEDDSSSIYFEKSPECFE